MLVFSVGESMNNDREINELGRQADKKVMYNAIKRDLYHLRVFPPSDHN